MDLSVATGAGLQTSGFGSMVLAVTVYTLITMAQATSYDGNRDLHELL